MAKARTLFLSDYCLTPFENIPVCGILCEKGFVIGTGGESGFSMDEPGLEIVRVENSYAVPGLIDSHIHGSENFDASNAADDDFSLEELGKNLASHGVTTYFPTIISQKRDVMLNTVSALASKMAKVNQCGAFAQGIHIEGPFINPEKRGDQDVSAIQSKVDTGYVKELFAAGNCKIKLMTFAPELEGAGELIELMLENGVIPSMGHSLADVDRTTFAIDAGARRCTYIFNGMPSFHHREASLTTVALTDDRVAVEMIVDGAHIHPLAVDIVARCKPPSKIIGVSNAVAGRGSDDNSSPLVTDEDGVIAGTTTTLESSWFHLMTFTNMKKTRAAACFTSNPADDLGLVSRGELKPGKRADITFFDKDTNTVRMTVVNGQIVYESTKE